MAVHDWTRVDAGIFHDFHNAWITFLRNAFNGGLLPKGYYALGEQFAGPIGPDVLYAAKQCNLVIRHSNGDKIVAILEIVSSCNKGSDKTLRKLIEMVLTALAHGSHVLIVDLYPPTSRDRQGIHGLIWNELVEGEYQQPADKPLTLASYTAGLSTTAYVQPVAVGDDLIEMPLFLDPDFYVKCPLEKTYREAYLGVPDRWKKVLERQS